MADTKRAIRGKEILVTPNGRPRRFPLVKMSNKIERRNYRQGINFNVQSYCSDIVMNVLYNIYNNLYVIRGRLMLTVHDSIVFEVPKSEIAKVNVFLEENITEHIKKEFPDIPVPMTYGFKVGSNYGEMSKL
jgi:DNA polymerase-1